MDESRLLLLEVGLVYARALAVQATRRTLETIAVRSVLSFSEPDAVALCVVGADGDGATACDQVRSLAKLLRGVPIVVLAERIETDSVVRLMRMGVADVVGLPAPPDDVAERVLQHVRSPGGNLARETLVGSSPAATRLREEIAAIGRTRSTVLITGETGTGKGLAARLIHRMSNRCDGPFVHLDCASISATLIESELFGHERGAFTGATERRKGRFELADEGTVFLDEIGELDLPLQAKLLRVLEDREYERVGGNRTLRMGARVIAATNRDLRSAIDEGAFRTDLYFRLNIFRLPLPALRDRIDDVPLLVRWALRELAERLAVPVPRASNAFLDLLMEYHWPGNVRELFSVLERLLVRGAGELLEADDLAGALPREMGRPDGGTAASRVADLDPDEESDRARVATALQLTGGNVARAARRLRLPRSTLRYRIRRYDLQDLIPRD
jgi:DNA-binding NtrC family response regulator